MAVAPAEIGEAKVEIAEGARDRTPATIKELNALARGLAARGAAGSEWNAALALSGRTDDFALPVVRVPCASALRKKPGRTEYQRGIVARDGDGRWTVRVTGSQGSGVLRSMSEANCFIVLEHERGDVQPGDLVSVQLMDGLA